MQANRPRAAIVPARGRWFNRGTLVRCIPAAGQGALGDIVEAPSGDHQVLMCRDAGLDQADFLVVEIQKIR